MTARFSIPTLSLLAVLALAGCMSPEQRMALKVEGMMERQQFDGALRYLDGYLAKHNKSLNGWRYRVLIRLEQGDRGQAAQEYVALNEALSRHEPEVLREVVLGGGGRWLLSDYRALARCGAAGVVDAAFFADLVEPKLLGEGSMSKVAVSGDEIAAVVDALPGRLAPSETWPIVARFVERATGHGLRGLQLPRPVPPAGSGPGWGLLDGGRPARRRRDGLVRGWTTLAS